MTEAHRRQKQPQLIRGQLLAVVRSLLVEQGPHAVTLDAVAKQANVSKGGVLYAFGTKDALINAMMQRVVANFDRAVEASLARTGDSPHNRIHAYVEANRLEDAEANTRAIALMASLVRRPTQLQRAALLR